VVLVVSFILLASNAKSNNTFGIYIITFLTFIGWIVTFFAIGTGLVVLPYEFLYSYLNKPKKVTVAEFDVLKQIMLNDLLTLRKRAKALENERPLAEKKSFLK